jgi:hypothetical protein
MSWEVNCGRLRGVGSRRAIMSASWKWNYSPSVVANWRGQMYVFLTGTARMRL